MDATPLELVDAEMDEISKRTTDLRSQLHPLEERQSILFNEREKLIRALVPFTDEQIDSVIDNLRTKKEIMVFFDGDNSDSECEDDGSIHVTRNGVRFCRDGKESELNGFISDVERAWSKFMRENLQK